MQSNQIDEFKEALELETRKSSMWQKKYLEIQVLSKIKEEKYDVLEDIEEEPNSFQEISISKKNIENQKDNKKNSKIEESKIPEENKTISINLQKENSTNEKPIKIVDSIASTTKTK